jgi:GNAT superfamily N-acetyltransferase
MIRTAKLIDAEEITRLCTQLGYSVTIEQTKSRIERLTNDKNNAILVYETTDDNLSGWVHVFGKCLIELEYAEIGGLIVDSNFRRQGIGLQLMKKCEEWAKENGYQEIRLRSGGQRKEAHEFYKQIGYKNINWQQLFILKLE